MKDEPQKPVLPIGRIEIRTFMRSPMCPWCQEKNAKRWLRESQAMIAVDVGPALSTWTCDYCDFSVTLPPGAFPSYDHEEVHLQPSNKIRQPGEQ